MRPARILVVDDEPGMLRAVDRVLSKDHHVVGTRRSRDALSMAGDFDPELAIVDIRMPDLDGFELMAQLKARFAWSLSNLVALLRMNLFVYRDLWTWLDDPFTPPPLLAGPVQQPLPLT